MKSRSATLTQLLDDHSELAQIHNELRQLAKGTGISPTRLLRCEGILELACVKDEEASGRPLVKAAESAILCAIIGMGSPLRRRFLIKMLNMDHDDVSLTERQHDFAQEEGVSLHEQRQMRDDAYLNLAGDLIAAERSPCRFIPPTNLGYGPLIDDEGNAVRLELRSLLQAERFSLRTLVERMLYWGPAADLASHNQRAMDHLNRPNTLIVGAQAFDPRSLIFSFNPEIAATIWPFQSGLPEAEGRGVVERRMASRRKYRADSSPDIDEREAISQPQIRLQHLLVEDRAITTLVHRMHLHIREMRKHRAPVLGNLLRNATDPGQHQIPVLPA